FAKRFLTLFLASLFLASVGVRRGRESSAERGLAPSATRTRSVRTCVTTRERGNEERGSVSVAEAAGRVGGVGDGGEGFAGVGPGAFEEVEEAGEVGELMGAFDEDAGEHIGRHHETGHELFFWRAHVVEGCEVGSEVM